MRRIKVGVVGAGHFGSAHARIYAGMEAVTLAGIADVNPQAARKLADQTGAPACDDPHALLGKVEAVSIATPPQAHGVCARPYLEAGCAVLIEKPLALEVAEARQLVETAHKHHAPLLVGHVERFSPGVIALLDRNMAPRFIEARRMCRFAPRGGMVDVVRDLMIHDIDIILALVGSDPVSISVKGTPVLTGQIDIVNAHIEFENGAAANAAASRVSIEDHRHLRLFSEQGYASLDFLAQSLHTVAPAPAAVPETAPGEAPFPGLEYRRTELTGPPPLEAELAHFIQIARNRELAPRVDGRQGLRSLEVTTQILERCRS